MNASGSVRTVRTSAVGSSELGIDPEVVEQLGRGDVERDVLAGVLVDGDADGHRRAHVEPGDRLGRRFDAISRGTTAASPSPTGQGVDLGRHRLEVVRRGMASTMSSSASPMRSSRSRSDRLPSSAPASPAADVITIAIGMPTARLTAPSAIPDRAWNRARSRTASRPVTGSRRAAPPDGAEGDRAEEQDPERDGHDAGHQGDVLGGWSPLGRAVRVGPPDRADAQRRAAPRPASADRCDRPGRRRAARTARP